MPELNPVAMPGPGRTPGDGNLYIRFIDVGQGDCIYVIFPNGKRMLVDCGSSRWDGLGLGDFQAGLDYYQYNPFNPFLTYLELDVLVLTHGDEDHYSLLGRLIGASPIQWVYYGGDLSNDFTLYNFRDWVHSGVANIQHAPQQLVVNATDPDFKVLVDGTVPGGGMPCGAYAVAGCVPPAPANANNDAWRKNTNSIVTKISFGADSALLCGDATSDTEDYMVSRAGSVIEGGYLSVRSMSIPHHGSNSSSTPNFVLATNPNYAVITAKNQNSYGLPRLSRVNRWLAAPDMAAAAPEDQHYIATYDDYNNFAPIQTTRNVWQTGISGTLTITMNGM